MLKPRTKAYGRFAWTVGLPTLYGNALIAAGYTCREDVARYGCAVLPSIGKMGAMVVAAWLEERPAPPPWAALELRVSRLRVLLANAELALLKAKIRELEGVTKAT